MEDALKLGADCLRNHFAEVRRWSEGELCQTRRVWLECFGLPPHVWSYETLRKIGSVWGKVVCLDKKTSKGDDFSSAKILIDTCSFAYIHRWVYFSVGDNGFDTYVKELGCYDPGLWNVDKIKNQQSVSKEDEQSVGDEDEPCKEKDGETEANPGGSLNVDTWKQDITMAPWKVVT